MSLSWNIEDVQGHEVESRDDVGFIIAAQPPSAGGGEARRLHPTTESLIFATMSIGISRIDEKNADEFFARLRLIERVHGTMMTNGDGSQHFITPAEVRAHIGLWTNASSLTRAQFVKQQITAPRTGALDSFVRQARLETPKATATSS